MIPFLKAVALAYTSQYKDLSRMCFLFPNKRSGVFFLKYYRELCGDKPMIAPQVMTISEFVEKMSGKVVASSLDTLFLLYKEYCALIAEEYNEENDTEEKKLPDEILPDFEAFRRWGETAIADFDLIDRYLIDADEIFKNVKDFREISSNYLTEEQKEVMEKYFGQVDFNDPEDFWKDFEKESEKLTELKAKFIHIWRVLSLLYERLKVKLEAAGLTTSGGAYRLASINLSEKKEEILPWDKMAVIGFNALSTSEYSIFKTLKKISGNNNGETFCDFFWDATGPILTQENNSASRFVRANMRLFPMPQWSGEYLLKCETDELPDITIVAAPSNSAQAQISSIFLNKSKEEQETELINAAEVAVVLPDESLLIPVLYSLPDSIPNVNLTMGYPYRLTSIVTFFSMIRRLYTSMHFEKGVPAFFHEDLIRFLSHPYSLALLGAEAIKKIRDFILKNHPVIISLFDIEKCNPKSLAPFNLPSHECTSHDVITYMSSLIELIESNREEEKTALKNLERGIFKVYRNVLIHVDDLITNYGIEMSALSVFRIIDRLLINEKINFEGEPLMGLQIMGTLETRALDFRNLIILSLNEKIMPGKRRSKSFIPETLRRAYGLPPSKYSEEIFAYYFYRMISRAKKVTLVYDARTSSGMKSGGPSRYIHQLRNLFAPGKIKEEEWKFNLAEKNVVPVSIYKSENILHSIESFCREGERNLSASTLSTYRTCQVKFFYSHVLGLNMDPEKGRYIDSITMGLILHAVMLDAYLPEGKRKKLLETPILISKEKIAALIADKDYLWKLITRNTNEIHFNIESEELLARELTGAAAMVAEQIMGQILEILERDLEIAPFLLHGAEIEETIRVKLKTGRTVNFRFAIDRLDELKDEKGDTVLRVVDYKTGKEKIYAKDFDDIFSGNSDSSHMFQLFTYAWLLNKKKVPNALNVRMQIYSTASDSTPSSGLPKIGSDMVYGFGEYAERFDEYISDFIEDIFINPEFNETPIDNNCKYCEFKLLCKKRSKD